MNTELVIAVAAIVGVLILLNGIFLTVIFFMQRRVNVVSEWPSTTGTVQTSRIETRSGSDGSTDYPIVTYSYKVMGQDYQGSRIAPGMEVGGSGAAGVIARYPIGAQVPVYYDPQNPSDAVLEKKAPAQLWLWIILGAFDCVLCGILPIIYSSLSQ